MHWHRQIYGGLEDIRTCSPLNMGHAAAYETYRIWTHNRSISDPGSDYDERHEAFIAIAIAEGQGRHATPLFATPFATRCTFSLLNLLLRQFPAYSRFAKYVVNDESSRKHPRLQQRPPPPSSKR